MLDYLLRVARGPFTTQNVLSTLDLRVTIIVEPPAFLIYVQRDISYSAHTRHARFRLVGVVVIGVRIDRTIDVGGKIRVGVEGRWVVTRGQTDSQNLRSG